MKGYFFRLVIFALLAVGSYWFVRFEPMYNPVGEQLLANNAFDDGFAGWITNNTKNTVTVHPESIELSSENQGTVIQIRQVLNITGPGQKYLLRAKVKGTNIQGGEKGWHAARVVAVQYADDKAVYKTPHSMVSLRGSHDWKVYEMVITIQPQISKVVVALQLIRSSGSLEVKDLTFFRTEPNPWFFKGRIFFFCVWGIYFFTLFVPIAADGAQRQSRIFSAAILMVFVLVVWGTMMPAQLKTEMKEDILTQAREYSEVIVKQGGQVVRNVAHEIRLPLLAEIDITKIGHFCLFAFLSFLLTLARGRERNWSTLQDALMLASATELMQFYVEGRTPLFSDVGIDVCGASLGICLASWIVGKLQRRRKQLVL